MEYHFENNPGFAEAADRNDPLQKYRDRFYFPRHNGRDVIYFCGNSLGLQPRNVAAAIETELQSWRELAIEGYFSGPNPWLNFHEYLAPALGKMMGASESEITVMNALTVNLHLLMMSFYRPTRQRYKILVEAGAFPSDQYAVETQVKLHGFAPEDAIIEVTPRKNEKLICEADILDAIQQSGDSLALVLLGGINYYTGQFFDIEKITATAHAFGIPAGWDLAHVAGNVPVQLHNWEVDFAVWCSYKYLNAGPGGAGGVFVHEKHAGNSGLSRLGGWWGNDEKTRFRMEKGFFPKQGAAGWNVSTTQVFNCVALKASLEIFTEATMDKIREKSILLTGYLEFLLHQLSLPFEILTPADPQRRGAQLCLYFQENGKAIQEKMIRNGIVTDYREPGVIRVAPAPLYCSFGDVYRFYEILKNNF